MESKYVTATNTVKSSGAEPDPVILLASSDTLFEKFETFYPGSLINFKF